MYAYGGTIRNACAVWYYNDHVLHIVYVYMYILIVPAMLTELLHPFQDDDTLLHLAARGGHAGCVEYLLSTSGIDVNIQDVVSQSIES